MWSYSHSSLIRHPGSTNLTIVSEDSAAPSTTQPLNSSLWWSLTTSKHGWTQFIMAASYDHKLFSNVIFFLEKYLLQESLVNRKNLTRLRISSHKLSVETGRFDKTPLEKRLCAMCDKGLVKDEFHFMISCTAYEKPRDHLFKYLSSFTDTQNLSDNEIFSVLMFCNNGDYEFTKAVCDFVNLSFEILSDYLKSVNQVI